MSSTELSIGSLDQQHSDYLNSPFLAMPIAGATAWTIVCIAGATLPLYYAVWALFFGTGSIFYLGLGIAKITGEDLMGRRRKGNLFDRIFILVVVSALLAYAIAIPFFFIDPTSLPLSVGILTGLMWVPISGLLGHWIGLFHGISRTILVLAAWYIFPADRFVVIPAVIVAIYLVTIFTLARRYSGLTSQATEFTELPTPPRGVRP